MNEQNKKKEGAFLVYLAIVIYLIALFICSHLNILMNVENYTIYEAIQMLTERITKTPFDIFPINIKMLLSLSIVAAFFCFWAWIDFDRRRKMMIGKENGTAKWGNSKEFTKKYTEKNYYENMIFTQTEAMSLNTRKTRKNNNVLVVGGSGAGKSRFMVKPNLLQANTSFVITDPSGELLETTAGFLEKAGYTIKVFNLVEMSYSNRYNPFQYIRNEVGIRMMINTLIQNTTPTGASKGDPFWEKSETALLEAICLYLYYECKPEEQNFSNVMNFLRAAEVKEGKEDYESTLDLLFKQLKEKDPNHIAVRTYRVFKQAGGATGKSILISASVRLNVFNYKMIENLTKTDNLDLGSIGDKKTALFVVIPAADTTFNFLVSMMYSQLFETLYFHAETECKGKRLPVHTRFMLDEFANIGTIPDFEKKLATMRKYEISCTIILQNMSQLKTMYKDSWESITGNCDSFLFLGGKEQTTREYISKELGKATIYTQNSSKNYGSKGGSSLSFNKAGRELLTSDEIGQMKDNECILMVRGVRPFFSNKYDYTKHKNYNLTGDADSNLLYDYRNKFNTADCEPEEKEEYSYHFKALKDKSRTNKIKIPEKDTTLQTETKNGIKTFVNEEVSFEKLQEIGINSPADIEKKIELVEDNSLCEFAITENFESFDINNLN